MDSQVFLLSHGVILVCQRRLYSSLLVSLTNCFYPIKLACKMMYDLKSSSYPSFCATTSVHTHVNSLIYEPIYTSWMRVLTGFEKGVLSQFPCSRTAESLPLTRPSVPVP